MTHVWRDFDVKVVSAIKAANTFKSYEKKIPESIAESEGPFLQLTLIDKRNGANSEILNREAKLMFDRVPEEHIVATIRKGASSVYVAFLKPTTEAIMAMKQQGFFGRTTKRDMLAEIKQHRNGNHRGHER